MFDPKRKINHTQKVLTSEQFKKLVENHSNRDQDHAPVVKFFDPMGAATWLVSELDPETGIGFGLCDLGMACPELGSVDLNELIDLQRGRALGIERDIHFHADKPMSQYVDEADQKGRIDA